MRRSGSKRTEDGGEACGRWRHEDRELRSLEVGGKDEGRPLRWDDGRWTMTD